MRNIWCWKEEAGGPQIKEARRYIAKAIAVLGLDRDKMELSSEEIAGANGEREEEFRSL